ncbi:MAG: transcription antitermination protein NusB, partial [Leptospiraceae bacterium]|nr:transcription antitermination protein NusB [Leptospiraceae bacterium]
DIDTLIEEHLIGWSFPRLTRVTRAILRTAVAQICYMAGDVAPAVIIDESIMLARKYDDDSAVPFINGVLDSIVRTLLPPATPPPRAEKIRIKRSAVKKSNPP